MATVAYRCNLSSCVEAERDAVHVTVAYGRVWGFLMQAFGIFMKVFSRADIGTDEDPVLDGVFSLCWRVQVLSFGEVSRLDIIWSTIAGKRKAS